MKHFKEIARLMRQNLPLIQGQLYQSYLTTHDNGVYACAIAVAAVDTERFSPDRIVRDDTGFIVSQPYAEVETHDVFKYLDIENPALLETAWLDLGVSEEALRWSPDDVDIALSEVIAMLNDEVHWTIYRIAGWIEGLPDDLPSL